MHPLAQEFCLLGQGGVSPPGLARIATPTRGGRITCPPHRWRQPSGAGEDRNEANTERVHPLGGSVASALRGWRGSQPPWWRQPPRWTGRRGVSPPGLARIATAARAGVPGRGGRVASALRGWRGSQQRVEYVLDRLGTGVASALRGWRGSQPAPRPGDPCPGSAPWRQPSGAGEDRNEGDAGAPHGPHAAVASALRGWRGSQLPKPQPRQHVAVERGVSPPGLARIATPTGPRTTPTCTSGVSPPGLARIATGTCIGALRTP